MRGLRRGGGGGLRDETWNRVNFVVQVAGSRVVLAEPASASAGQRQRRDCACQVGAKFCDFVHRAVTCAGGLWCGGDISVISLGVSKLWCVGGVAAGA